MSEDLKSKVIETIDSLIPKGQNSLDLETAAMAYGITRAKEAVEKLFAESSTQTNDSNTLNALDTISRQAAIDEVCKMMYECFGADEEELDAIEVTLHELPSAQAEPLSDAYMKAVWTWLLDYQLKAVEMEGKYTPYEVLSWVVNDWRKEHGSN